MVRLTALRKLFQLMRSSINATTGYVIGAAVVSASLRLLFEIICKHEYSPTDIQKTKLSPRFSKL